jgi:acyl dehydratase
VAVPFPRCLNQIVWEVTVVAARDFIMTELVTKQDLQTAVDTLTLRLTVRLGGIIAAGVGVLGAAMGMLVLFLRLH